MVARDDAFDDCTSLMVRLRLCTLVLGLDGSLDVALHDALE